MTSAYVPQAASGSLKFTCAGGGGAGVCVRVSARACGGGAEAEGWGRRGVASGSGERFPRRGRVLRAPSLAARAGRCVRGARRLLQQRQTRRSRSDLFLAAPPPAARCLTAPPPQPLASGRTTQGRRWWGGWWPVESGSQPPSGLPGRPEEMRSHVE